MGTEYNISYRPTLLPAWEENRQYIHNHTTASNTAHGYARVRSLSRGGTRVCRRPTNRRRHRTVGSVAAYEGQGKTKGGEGRCRGRNGLGGSQSDSVEGRGSGRQRWKAWRRDTLDNRREHWKDLNGRHGRCSCQI